LVAVILFMGCEENKPAVATAPGDARQLFTNAMARFHGPAVEARGAERDRLLNEAAKEYESLLKSFPAESNLCAQSLRALGSIHAIQGRTNEAIKSYGAVGERYGSEDWEVLQAWKAAADLLWEAGRRDEAKKLYAKIVGRFGNDEAPQIFRQVVRGSKARLAE